MMSNSTRGCPTLCCLKQRTSDMKVDVGKTDAAPTRERNVGSR